MDIHFLLRGLAVGFSIAAPVGPIGVLCIRRTLTEGRLSGLVSGLGAATADAFYGCVAGFGLTFISNILVREREWLHLIGGLYLCYLGVRIVLTHTPNDQDAPPQRSLPGAYGSTFFLTLTNPMTILSFVAIFAGVGLAGTNNSYISAASLVLGVFLGSAGWWLTLSAGVSMARGRIGVQSLRLVNMISGTIVIAFGVYALVTLF